MHPSHREARIESDGRCRPKRILIDCVRAGDSDANRAIPVVRNRPEGITGHAALSYLIAMIGMRFTGNSIPKMSSAFRPQALPTFMRTVH